MKESLATFYALCGLALASRAGRLARKNDSSETTVLRRERGSGSDRSAINPSLSSYAGEGSAAGVATRKSCGGNSLVVVVRESS